jgi:transglutaminase-like putative cysteine protease
MLAKRFIGVAIVVFWCVMNAILIRRQFAAPPTPIALNATERISESIEEWWGVYYRGEKIGYATQTIEPKSTGYELRDYSELRLRLLGTNQTATTKVHMDVDEEWALERFDFELRSGEVHFKASGRVLPGRLMVETYSAGHRATQDIPLTQRPYLLAALKPFVATQQLEEKKDYYFSTFDPATLSQQVTKVVIEGRETIRIGDLTEPALRVRQQFKGISVTSWIDGSGRTLKEESPAGLSMTRQSREQARQLGAARSVSLDLIARTSIPVTTPIIQPGTKKVLKLRLSGFDPASFMLAAGRQQFSGDIVEVRREKIEKMVSIKIPSQNKRLVAFLQPTPYLQSDNPAIRTLAAEILAGETDAGKAALRLKDWVYRNIAKRPTISIPNALEVLKTRKGDCNEHAVLFNALARAAGIPAKTVVGVVYLRGAFYYHAWSEVWLSEWVSLDPVLNQFPADVTHVKFLEGDIDRQVDILRLIGNLKIEVLEAG